MLCLLDLFNTPSANFQSKFRRFEHDHINVSRIVFKKLQLRFFNSILVNLAIFCPGNSIKFVFTFVEFEQKLFDITQLLNPAY